jgi:hypothetical protein
MSKTRLGSRIAALAVALALAMPASVAAAVGNYGPHYGQASCIGNSSGGFQIVVQAPEISSSAAGATPGISTMGSQHNQLVAYKINIFYSVDAATWTLSSESGWRAAWVADSFNSLGGPSLWYDYGALQWTAELQIWDLHLRGYYRAAVQYYWFADTASDAGEDYLWADHFDYTTTLQGVAYCTVP